MKEVSETPEADHWRQLSSGEDYDFEDIDLKSEDEDFEKNGQADEHGNEDYPSVSVNPLNPFRSHEACPARAFHDQEIHDGGDTEAAENCADLFVHALEIEGEDQAHNVLNNSPAHKGDHNGYEDR